MLRQLNRVPVQTSSWTSIFSARTGTIRNSRPTCSTVQRLVTAHREQRRLGTLFAMKRDHIVMQATTADTDNKQVKVDMPPPGSALQGATN